MIIFLFGILISVFYHSIADVIPIWPMPASVSLGSTTVVLSESFKFTQSNTDGAISDRLNRAALRYQQRIKTVYQTSITKGKSKTSTKSRGKISQVQDANSLSVCTVTIALVYSDETEELNSLDLGVDESYTISLSSDSCLIKANTVWGGMNALATFIQLLEYDSSEDIVYSPYSPAIIDDEPRYSHRGLLIDTSRHYLPLESIYSLLSSFPMSKINVLHWHLVDAESFPFNSTTEPTMVEGAYAPTKIYSVDDMSRITSYAADRGIRIVYEIDVPGHAGSWVDGKPQIMADCLEKYTNVENYALNPSLDETYTTVTGIVTDLVAAQSPLLTKYVHLGGDEVVYGCWKNDASITDFMVEEGISSYDELLGYFVNRTDTLIQSQVTPVGADKPITVIHWEEVYFAGATVPTDTIFQVWTDATQMALVADGGHNILASPSDYWYLNYLSLDWETMYSYEPTTNLTTTQQALLLGGEACVWGEMVDGVNLETVVYPRLSAVAERLWSPITVTDESAAKTRLTVQRCRLVQQGYQSAAVQPDYCSIQYV